MNKLLGILVWWVSAVGLLASPTHTGPAAAEEEELEDQFGGPEGISMPEVQVVRFLGQHFPEMLGELETVEAEGEEPRREFLNRARGIILEWEEHFRMGEEVAKNFIEVERLHYRNDGLVAKYVKLAEGPEKVAMGDELRGNLTKIHDLRMVMERAELKRLKEEIAAIEENLEEGGANRATMVETEMRDLLEFWRLEQAGETAGRDREEPLIPAELVKEPPVASERVNPAKLAERVELARPVEEGAGGGFIEREDKEEARPAEPVEEEAGEKRAPGNGGG